MQDVDRTFPDLEYFTLERVRRSMVTMLFLFSVMNPDVGYRQVSLDTTLALSSFIPHWYGPELN